ncbi:hypothetical protein ASPWEDRAFT_148352 [Aspergillus wentii DTO 134E9]|uniref:Serine hydrolase domain-containing protein n=1 Tax=Aspergillus wentii DTO 134E9 TaxID=1073089 RepID=A0A1L9RTF0_ASPWE|nr:uncharacterized protein ASPWEDRAFT_148352 [Aspergillus wentii DTO 134E9]KAI9933880.1 hypothetical protein MW887_004952 [Aspergillus wentii]OJJ38231.1 hypothetical protein ASPWEDRAFT_148352 [Aspergillus wentii DTO 134E9]
MRFLCLHGSGTSDEIFEIQSGGLRQQLEENGHDFIFMNGRLEAKPEPELEGICDGPFYNHFPRDVAPSENLAKAFEHTLNFMQREGPFDAVMGFSQGGSLAASMIIDHAKTHDKPLFKLAVFICSAIPFERTGTHPILPTDDGYPIIIPTANIVGNQDYVYPQSMHVYGLCDPSKSAFYDHGSKHGIPFDQKNTTAMTEVVEKTIERALRG